MNIEELREKCLSVKGSKETAPFIDNNVLCYKIMNKMFAFIDINPKDGEFRVALKCNPERSVELRERFNGITTAHVNSLLWNNIYLESDVSDKLINELIKHSVDEVIKKLTKIKQAEYLINK
jgi:predicted DNA-binding protein (MmcQ/YjbR family)